MFFSFAFKSSILLLFFLHALVFSVLLLLKAIQEEHKPSFWLSAFTFFSGLYIAPFMLGYAGWYSRQPYRDFMFYVPFQQLFLLPPILYFYVKTLLDPSFRFSRKDLFHFTPWFGYLIYSFLVFLVDKVLLQQDYFYADGRDKDLSPWYQFLGFISFITYTVLSLRLYAAYKNVSYQTVSYADLIVFEWVKRFLIALLLILILRGLLFILNPEWDQFGNKFWYYLCFSILFYYISISGYVNAIRSIHLFKMPMIKESVDVKEAEQDDSSESNLTDQFDAVEMEHWKARLEHAMIADKLYQNPMLTLSDVAQHIQLNARRVSQLVNQGFGMNFNDFVNFYRTQAVISHIKEGNHNLLTLLAIAYECGFNSKSTFNRAFKKHTQLTPRAYLAQNKP